ncbi:hypothetical protein D3C76_1424690 [compost metagenome]
MFDIAGSGLGAEPFAQQPRIAAGAFGQLFRTDRLVVGHRLVQAQFIAEQDAGEHGRAAHVGDQTAHEVVEFCFVHGMSSVAEHRRAESVRACAGRGGTPV